MSKRIHIAKVVTRNIVHDFIASVQNVFGANLNSYESMITNAMTQIDAELSERKVKMVWYRYEITQLTNGAVAVMMYGETK